VILRDYHLGDSSNLNLFKRSTEGWDINLSYRIDVSFGRLDLSASETIIEHIKQQTSLTLPNREYVDFPNSGSGANKYNCVGAINWEKGIWSAGWNMRYFSSYSQQGAPGDPITTDQSLIPCAGSYANPSQQYHDFYVGCSFDGSRSTSGSGSRVRRIMNGAAIVVGVKNAFNAIPPFDANLQSNGYMSPYGDVRLRSYWLSVRKAF